MLRCFFHNMIPSSILHLLPFSWSVIFKCLCVNASLSSKLRIKNSFYLCQRLMSHKYEKDVSHFGKKIFKSVIVLVLLHIDRGIYEIKIYLC